MLKPITEEFISFMYRLIYQYLRHAGFMHAAFCLEREARLNTSQIEAGPIPDVTLARIVWVGLLQKEAVANNARPHEPGFVSLSSVDLITKNLQELQKIVEDKRQEVRQKDLKKEDEGTSHQKTHGCHQTEGTDISTNIDSEMLIVIERLGTKDISATSTSYASVIPPSDVIILDDNGTQVYGIAWSPSGSSLVAGLQNSRAHIWTIFDETADPIPEGDPSELVLVHETTNVPLNQNVVTVLDWNEDGTLLGTGTFDGQVRIWTKYGMLKHTLIEHKGPVYILKWNRSGNFILTGGLDQTAIVWSVNNLAVKKRCRHHPGTFLGGDWLNDVSFATCSSDNKIRIWRMSKNSPTKIFSIDQDAVNLVQWDPTGSLLASCSLDNTVKIWNMNKDQCVHDFTEHQKAIMAMQWSPTGPGSKNPNQPLILASASMDSTVKLWDVEQGKLLSSLNRHWEPVNAIGFSPNGEYLASGSQDGVVYIWSVKEGKAIKSYTGEGRVANVLWNKRGNKLAVTFLKTVCVLDVRM